MYYGCSTGIYLGYILEEPISYRKLYTISVSVSDTCFTYMLCLLFIELWYVYPTAVLSWKGVSVVRCIPPRLRYS